MEREVPAAESEAHRLVKDNFKIGERGFSVLHFYDLRTH